MRTVITGKLTANIGVACIIDDGLARGSAGVLHVLGRCRLGQARTRLRGWGARSCSRLSASRAQVSFPHPPWPPVAARFLIERDPAGPSRTRQVRTELPLRSTTTRWRDSHPHHHTNVFATVVRLPIHMLFLAGKGSTANYQHNAPCNSVALVSHPSCTPSDRLVHQAKKKKKKKKRHQRANLYRAHYYARLFAPPLGCSAVGSAHSLASDDGGRGGVVHGTKYGN